MTLYYLWQDAETGYPIVQIGNIGYRFKPGPYKTFASDVECLADGYEPRAVFGSYQLIRDYDGEGYDDEYDQVIAVSDGDNFMLYEQEMTGTYQYYQWAPEWGIVDVFGEEVSNDLSN